MPEKKQNDEKIIKFADSMKGFIDNPREAFDTLSHEIEQKHEVMKTKNFLAGLNEDLVKEWVNTQDYENLMKKILGYDADVSMKDARYIAKVPRRDFVEAAKMAVEIAEMQKQEKYLKEIDPSQISAEILKQKLHEKKLQEKKIESMAASMQDNKVAAELFGKIGIVDGVQFTYWLTTSDEAKEFVYGPFKDMEEYLVWKLVKQNGGTYEIPEGTKDESWFY
jgi:hypothetical protein